MKYRYYFDLDKSSNDFSDCCEDAHAALIVAGFYFVGIEHKEFVVKDDGNYNQILRRVYEFGEGCYWEDRNLAEEVKTVCQEIEELIYEQIEEDFGFILPIENEADKEVNIDLLADNIRYHANKIIEDEMAFLQAEYHREMYNKS